MEKTQNVYTVSQVNSYIKGKFACDALLNNICVKGEVISCKYHNSGHIYFTIQDTVSQLSVVMFKGNTFRGLKFKLENGQQVVVNGKVNIYEKWKASALCCRNKEVRKWRSLRKISCVEGRP